MIEKEKMTTRAKLNYTIGILAVISSLGDSNMDTEDFAKMAKIAFDYLEKFDNEYTHG